MKDIGDADTTLGFHKCSSKFLLSKGFLRHFLILSTWASGSKSRLFSSFAKRPFETFLLDQKNGFGSNGEMSSATLITSNRAFGEWGDVFGDPVVATAILDRLLRQSHVVTIKGESCRLKSKKRSGIMPAKLAADSGQ
jgi:hypothetical protein